MTALPRVLETDERRTPKPLFATCTAVWGPYDLDAAAADWNHQVARYITIENDLFAVRPSGRRVWLNPPYSRGNLMRFLSFAREMVLLGCWSKLVTCLIPLDCSTDWWRTCVARPEGCPLCAEWLYGCFPPPFTNATRYVSERLIVTVVPVEGRQAFDPRRGTRDAEKFRGAKQPSCIVNYERNLKAGS